MPIKSKDNFFNLGSIIYAYKRSFVFSATIDIDGTATT